MVDPEDPRKLQRRLKNETNVMDPYVVRFNWFLNRKGIQVQLNLLARLNEQEAMSKPGQYPPFRYHPPPLTPCPPIPVYLISPQCTHSFP
jgi:hypothetical protein